MAKLAFLGLGVMGYHMAGHLQRCGHELTVYNRTSDKAQQWVSEFGGALAQSPAAAVGIAEAVFLCLGNDESVRSVLGAENGVLAGVTAGTIIVDHTTASATLAREMHARCALQGVGFVDAPVSGGAEGARNGVLTVMAGGDQAHFDVVEPWISCFAKRVRRLGASGAGQLTKMANQICVGGVLAGLSEALHFVQQAGLDAAAVIDVISKGAAQSWQMENRWATMVAGEYAHGFAVDLMIKDLGIVREAAATLHIDLPATELVHQLYRDVQAMGGGRWDTSSLLARLQQQKESGDD